MEVNEIVELIPLFSVNGLFPVYSTVQEGFSLDRIKENLAYVIDSRGWKLYKKNSVAYSLIKIDDVAGFASLDESIDLVSTKIPYELIYRVTAFFTAVYKKNRSEAVGYLYYKPETGEWDFIPPAQTATAASAAYDKAPDKGPGWLVAGTIHSHGSMSAFHSGTDPKDEEHFDGIHITIGKVDGSNPEYSCSVVADKARTKFDKLEDLVEAPPESSTPEWLTNWMNAIKLSPLASWEYNKLDEKIQKKIDRLYERYLHGKISEKVYEEDLAKYTGNTGLTAEEQAEFFPNGLADHAMEDLTIFGTPVQAASADYKSRPSKYNPLSFLDVRRYNGRWGKD
jgi:hypothetical protein